MISEESDLFGKKGLVWLTALIADTSAPLRDSARTTLASYLDLLAETRKRVAVATRQFRTVVRREPAARRLMTLPGVSIILGYTILAEVGRIERFKDGRHLASYSLLAPMADDSGDDHPGQAPIGRHVGRIGRTTLKWAWIEAARSAVRKSPRMRAFFNRYTHEGKYNRNRGYIAVAHQLCLIGYVLWKKDRDYQETPPSRPGARTQNLQPENSDARSIVKNQTLEEDDSRRGTGQPQRRMAMQNTMSPRSA